VVSPFGERFSSDESRHQIVVEQGGSLDTFGAFGSGAGDFRFPRGLGFLPGMTRATSRLFVCDAWNHRVQVFDGHGTFRMAFGGRGTGDGQLDVPSAIAVVSPRLPGDSEEDCEPLIAVVDQSGRLQIFMLDGVFFASCPVPDIFEHGHARVRLVWDAGVLRILIADVAAFSLDLARAIAGPEATPVSALPPPERASALRIVSRSSAAERS
jgi:hypothetical protein